MTSAVDLDSEILKGLTLEDIPRVLRVLDPMTWATETAKIRLPRSGPLTFDMHPFLIGIYRDTHPAIVALKGAQLGLSTWAIIRELWALTTWPMSAIYCVDEATELLSDRGWLARSDVQVGENILTLDLFTGTSRWSPVEEVFDTVYDGPMVGLDNRSFDALVTPDHRWPALPLHGSRWHLYETSKLPDFQRIPLSAPFVSVASSALTDDEVELLGWVVTEGSYRHETPNDTSIVITQNEGEAAERIRALLRRLGVTSKTGRQGGHESSEGKVRRFWFHGARARLVRGLAPDKELLPAVVAMLTVPQLKLLVQTMLDGDGDGVSHFWQRSRTTTDSFAMAAVLAGNSVSIGYRRRPAGTRGAVTMDRETEEWLVTLKSSSYVQTETLTRTEGRYVGHVWCPRTRDRTFLARRGGKVYWTGNTFPSSNDVNQHTAARINPIISSSDYLTDRIVDINSVAIKRFGLRGLSSIIGGKKLAKADRTRHLMDYGLSTAYFSGAASSRDAISRDADFLIHDEEDQSNPDVIEQYRSRISGPGSFKWIIRLSTPTVPGYGISAAYDQSDRRHWMLRCPYCDTDFEMAFPECIEPQTWEEHDRLHDPLTQEGAPCPDCHYRCPRCEHHLSDDDRSHGQWIAESPGRGLPHGYSVSQMSALYMPAVSILKARFDAKWPRNFWNLTMGQPFDDGTASFTRLALLGNPPEDYGACDPNRPMAVTSRASFMGVDVGSSLDVVIDEIVDGKARTIRFERPPDWDRLDELMREFNVVVCVIDGLPETHNAQAFARRWNRDGQDPRVWQCFFGGDDSQIRYDHKTGHVIAPRDQLLTETAAELVGVDATRTLPAYVRGNAVWEAFVQHHLNSKRIAVFEQGMEKYGAVRRYHWINVGPDHLFFGGAYARLARLAPRPYAPPQTAVISLNRAARIKREQGAINPDDLRPEPPRRMG